MSRTVKALGIDQFTREERLALVQEIWDTIAAEQSPPLLNEAQRRELERRVREDETSPAQATPWEQVKARILARMQP